MTRPNFCPDCGAYWPMCGCLNGINDTELTKLKTIEEAMDSGNLVSLYDTDFMGQDLFQGEKTNGLREYVSGQKGRADLGAEGSETTDPATETLV